MKIKVFPVGDRILIMRCKKKKYEGLMVIPDTTEEVKMPEFVIYKVGQGKLNRQTGEYNKSLHREGDIIWLSSYTGTELVIQGLDVDESIVAVKEESDSVIVVREEDVLMSDNPTFNTNSGEE